MGKAVKLALASGIAVILIGYLAASAYLDWALGKKAQELQAEKVSFVPRRELLYAQKVRLESSKAVLAAQLQYELDTKENQRLQGRFLSQPKDPTLTAPQNQTSLDAALKAQQAKLEAQLKAQTDAANLAQAQRLAQIKQKVTRSASSSGNPVVTRAS
jgi:hypothetical protein